MNIDTDITQQIKGYQLKSYNLIQLLKNDISSSLQSKLENPNAAVSIDKMKDLIYLSDINNEITRLLDVTSQDIDHHAHRLESLDNQLQSILYEKDLCASKLLQLESSPPFDINDPALNLSEESKFLETNAYHSNHQSNKIIERLEWEMSKRIEKLQELDRLKTTRKDLKEQELKKRKQLAEFDYKLKNNQITLQSILKPIDPYIKPIPYQQPLNRSNQINQLVKQTPLPLFILFNEIQTYKNMEYNYIDVDIKCIDPSFTTLNQHDSIDISSPLFKSYILTPSNIYITINISSSNDANGITLDFYYYPTLKIVTVLPMLNNNEEDGQSILEQIDSNDKGLTTPNQSNHFIFGNETFSLSTHKLKGRPFKWAQFITGLSFLPEISIDDLHNKDYHLYNFKPKTTNEIMKILIDQINQ